MPFGVSFTMVRRPFLGSCARASGRTNCSPNPEIQGLIDPRTLPTLDVVFRPQLRGVLDNSRSCTTCPGSSRLSGSIPLPYFLREDEDEIGVVRFHLLMTFSWQSEICRPFCRSRRKRVRKDQAGQVFARILEPTTVSPNNVTPTNAGVTGCCTHFNADYRSSSS